MFEAWTADYFHMEAQNLSDECVVFAAGKD